MGITLKAQARSMNYWQSNLSNQKADKQDSPAFLLNLIDTSGQVNFNYEAPHSLAAFQDLLIVIDGVLTKEHIIGYAATCKGYQVLEIGIMHPEIKPTTTLLTGHMGYGESPYNPYDSYIIGAMIGVDESIVALLQYYVIPSYENPFSSLAYVRVVLQSRPMTLVNRTENSLIDNAQFSFGTVQMKLKDYFRYLDQEKEEGTLYIFYQKFAEKVSELGMYYEVPKYSNKDLFSVMENDQMRGNYQKKYSLVDCQHL